MGLSTVTPPIAGVEIRDRAEALLRGALVVAPPTLGQCAQTPIFGTIPTPGHTYPARPSPTLGLTAHLLAR